jgi:two-component system, chemotaxis family, sensor kinase Cph1
LEQVLQSALTILQVTLLENAATVTHDPLPTVLGNSVLLVELFQNLLANALKYRSEQTPHIHISVQEHAAEWTVSIRDNGIGIDPQYREQIFLPLVRLHGSQISGTGIGLAICRKVVEHHGGHLEVKSALGSGSTFHVSLPKMVTTDGTLHPGHQSCGIGAR